MDLGLKKIETKQFIHYVTLASIMSHQLELGDYKVKMQILFSLRMVNSTHNMVYGAFSSTATEELLLCTYDSNICNRCLKRYVNIREFFSKYFLTVFSYFKILFKFNKQKSSMRVQKFSGALPIEDWPMPSLKLTNFLT